MKLIDVQQEVRPIAEVEDLADASPGGLEVQALMRTVQAAIEQYVANGAPVPPEAAVAARVDPLLTLLLVRRGDTIVVTNETGWGVVPAWPSARIFRDELGRANRRLTAAADAAYLVVDGRCLDLKKLPHRPAWPASSDEGVR